MKTDRQTNRQTDWQMWRSQQSLFAILLKRLRPNTSFIITQLRRHIQIRSWISSNPNHSGNNTLW